MAKLMPKSQNKKVNERSNSILKVGEYSLASIVLVEAGLYVLVIVKTTSTTVIAVAAEDVAKYINMYLRCVGKSKKRDRPATDPTARSWVGTVRASLWTRIRVSWSAGRRAWTAVCGSRLRGVAK